MEIRKLIIAGCSSTSEWKEDQVSYYTIPDNEKQKERCWVICRLPENYVIKYLLRSFRRSFCWRLLVVVEGVEEMEIKKVDRWTDERWIGCLLKKNIYLENIFIFFRLCRYKNLVSLSGSAAPPGTPAHFTSLRMPRWATFQRSPESSNGSPKSHTVIVADWHLCLVNHSYQR